MCVADGGAQSRSLRSSLVHNISQGDVVFSVFNVTKSNKFIKHGRDGDNYCGSGGDEEGGVGGPEVD